MRIACLNIQDNYELYEVDALIFQIEDFVEDARITLREALHEFFKTKEGAPLSDESNSDAANLIPWDHAIFVKRGLHFIPRDNVQFVVVGAYSRVKHI